MKSEEKINIQIKIDWMFTGIIRKCNLCKDHLDTFTNFIIWHDRSTNMNGTFKNMLVTINISFVHNTHKNNWSTRKIIFVCIVCSVCFHLGNGPSSFPIPSEVCQPVRDPHVRSQLSFQRPVRQIHQTLDIYKNKKYYKNIENLQKLNKITLKSVKIFL